MVFTDIVEYNGKHYYVDSRWTIHHGYETIAFLSPLSPITSEDLSLET